MGENTRDISVVGNYIFGSSDYGIDTETRESGNNSPIALGDYLIRSNTITANNTITPNVGGGIRLRSESGSDVIGNSIFGNFGNGVDVGAATFDVDISGNGLGVTLDVASTENLISMNEFGGNEGIAIDLNELGFFGNLPGISLDPGTNGDSGNNGIDAPAIELATFEGNQLRVRLLDNGALAEGGSIELYLASPGTGDSLLNGDSFGEGGTFIASVPVSDFVNGQWEITLDEPTFGFPDFMDGDSITAILIDNDSNTSEFGQNVEIDVIVPVVLDALDSSCLLYTSPSPRDATLSRMPSSA